MWFLVIITTELNTQPEVRLCVGVFDVGVLVFSAAAIFLASVHGKCLRYIEDVDVIFYEEKQSVVHFGTWTMNRNALWQLKSPQTKTRKTKTAC